MKDHLAALVSEVATPLQGRNVVREYLQARILECLQRGGAMIPLAFHGGTALRFLFSLPRFSEDLDFALEQQRERYDLRGWLKRIRATLEAESYRVEIKLSDERVVHGALVRFPGLLHDLRLSGRRDQIFSIKIEVDTRPPEGATVETTVIRRHVVLQLHHHDRSSLLAGKLHAVLMRPFAKGRDLYDLFWYLSARDWPPPNVRLLARALAQTGWDGDEPTAASWRRIVAHRLRDIDVERAVRDVAPFLERQGDVELLTRDNLLSLLG